MVKLQAVSGKREHNSSYDRAHITTGCKSSSASQALTGKSGACYGPGFSFT
jgi:hypothetical protein